MARRAGRPWLPQEAGLSPERLVPELARRDEHIEYRQIGVLDGEGDVAARTGDRTRGWHGHVAGEGFVAMGNGLAGAGVVEAMAEAFAARPEESLDERLLQAIEAGCAAGGQRPEGGEWLPERSAALVVYGSEEYALMDLRVDAHETAVEELRRVWSEYRPYVPLYYELRVKSPDRAPLQETWPTGQRRAGSE